LFFRASAARYRLGVAFADPPPAFAAWSENRALAPGVFPEPPWPIPQLRVRQPASLLNLPSPSESSSPEPPKDRRARRPCFLSEFPHEVPGPFSTSSREDLPIRGSNPASFRLRRFRDLDGFLPSRPCPFVSSGGTPGVPGSWPRRTTTVRCDRRPRPDPVPPPGPFELRPKPQPSSATVLC